MKEELKQKISEYLATHFYLNLATVSPECRPMAHTMAYVSEDTTVYLATNRSTRKVRNIMHNPAVAYTVDEDDPDWFDMQARQVAGWASVVEDEEEMRRIGEIMVGKFPVIADMPPDPDTVLIKIVPDIVYYLDYSVEFGYRDRATF